MDKLNIFFYDPAKLTDWQSDETISKGSLFSKYQLHHRVIWHLHHFLKQVPEQLRISLVSLFHLSTGHVPHLPHLQSHQDCRWLHSPTHLTAASKNVFFHQVVRMLNSLPALPPLSPALQLRLCPCVHMSGLYNTFYPYSFTLLLLFIPYYCINMIQDKQKNRK